MTKKDANRQNAAKSTGPRSKAGKRNMKFNAITHGFYATELIIPKGAEAEAETLRNSLCAELAPETPLQQVAFENVFCCCWRCKLAMRSEMMHLKAYFKATDEQAAPPRAPDENAAMTKWYGSNRETLRQGRRFLAQLRQDIEEHGWIHAELWKDSTITGFGAEFYDLLSRWAPMSVDTIRLADFLMKHSKTFNASPPPIIEKAVNDETVIVDPALQSQMMIKLISLQDQHLEAIARSYEQRGVASSDAHDHSMEFAPRYFTTATRDLHRAVDWFQYLKNNNL